MTWYERLWFVSGFTAIVVIFALNVFYHRRLRTRHRETWLDLGSPRLFQGLSSRSSEQHRFEWNREHRRLGDPVVDRLAAAIRISGVGFLALLAAELVLLYFVHDPPPAETIVRPATTDSGPDGPSQLPFVAAFLALGAISWTVHWRFVRRLRLYHPETWRQLGYPTFLSTGGPMLRFFWLLRFRALRDPPLDRLGFSLLVVSVLAVLVFFGAAFVVLPGRPT